MGQGTAIKPALRLPLQIVAPAPEIGPGASIAASAAVVVLVVAAAATPIPVLLRLCLCALVFVVARTVLRRARRAPSTMAVGYVGVDDVGIVREGDAGVLPVALWSEPFGLTVLANEARGRAILAFTTPSHTRYIHVRMRAATPEPAAVEYRSTADPFGGAGDDLGLLARAVTVADGDLQGDARVALGVEDAAKIVRVIAKRSPGAFDRIFLSDAAGGSVTVDASLLKVGERTFDLTAPLEWRGFMFHESGAHVATIYQGTWVKQSGVEVVFVAPMPAELSLAEARPDVPGGAPSRRAIARDLRLMQSLADGPPPRDLRVAVDRLFMLPLRRALDRAPRVSRPAISTRGGRPAVQT